MIAGDGMDVLPWVVSTVAIDQDVVRSLSYAVRRHIVF